MRKKNKKYPMTSAQRSKKWRLDNPQKYEEKKEYNKNRHRELKVRVLTYYGNGKMACVKCDFEDIRALSLDHIDRDVGVRFKGRTTQLYKYLEVNNYPKGYQTLCMNCQFIKRDEDYECFTYYERHKRRAQDSLVEALS